MEIVDVFASYPLDRWLPLLRGCPRGAAAFLASLIDEGRFFEALGDGSRLLLLTDGGAPVSFCTYSVRDEVLDDALTPWIGFAYTFEPYRGQRMLGRLIERAMAEAARGGHPAVYLSTDHIGLYEKYGFTFFGTRRTVWGEETRVYVRSTTGE